MPDIAAEVEWRDLGDRLAPFYQGRECSWTAQKGSQRLFLACPTFEVLLHGNRGGGKTEVLLMDFLQHVGKGLGRDWIGILFRQSYPQLEDVVNKSKKLCDNRGLREGTFNHSAMRWTWPGGEQLLFRHAATNNDFDKYKGFSIPWIAFEELTTWPTPDVYTSLISICRTSNSKVPLKLRSTTNPYGVGHNWVKARFQLPHTGVLGPIIQTTDDAGRRLPDRRAIFSDLKENLVLLKANPNYLQNVLASARSEAERVAWLEGTWDIVSGGMFDDVWGSVRNYAVVDDFHPPPSWRIDLGFDWGSSQPFSVGWYAESDGTNLIFPDGRVMRTVRGDVFRFGEWYGWNGEPNVGCRMLAKNVARGIVERSIEMGVQGRVRRGIADASIFDDDNDNCIARDMEASVVVDGVTYPGPSFDPADKRSGSRRQGWEIMRKLLMATAPIKDSPREAPGFFVTRGCTHFLRTVPTIPRNDREARLDDVDTRSEDHVADEVRYRLRREVREAKFARTWGMS